jgi:hypothetical protein
MSAGEPPREPRAPLGPAEWGRKGGLNRQPIDAWMKARDAANALLDKQPELTASELYAALHATTGITHYLAKKIRTERNRQLRAGRRAKETPSRAPRRSDGDEQWARVQAFLDAHPGQTFARAEITEATGVPRSTITALFRQHLGIPFSQSESASPAARALGRVRLLSSPPPSAQAAVDQLSGLPDEPEGRPVYADEDLVAMYRDYPVGSTFRVVGQSKQGAAIMVPEGHQEGFLYHAVRS